MVRMLESERVSLTSVGGWIGVFHAVSIRSHRAIQGPLSWRLVGCHDIERTTVTRPCPGLDDPIGSCSSIWK